MLQPPRSERRGTRCGDGRGSGRLRGSAQLEAADRAASTRRQQTQVRQTRTPPTECGKWQRRSCLPSDFIQTHTVR